MRLLSPLILLSLVALLAPPLTVHAQDAEFQIDFTVSHRMQEGQGDPAITFASPIFLRDATLTLTRAGFNHTEELGNLNRGQPRTVEFSQPAGTYGYTARLRGLDEEGRELTFEFRFEVIIVAPIEVEILVDRLDLSGGSFPIRVNRPVDRVEIEVHDSDGRRVSRSTETFDGRRGVLDIDYTASGGEVGQIRLVVHDEDGFWTAVRLEPFWTEIPHETVNFQTGSASFDDDQTPKLQDSLEKINELLAQHSQMDLRLYIAGYTDTVGSARSNLQLSERRARAIAQWFRANGVTIPIFYQGFGQEALAVSTPDETEEARNRRALYLLGNAPPPTSDQIPRSNWQRVR